MPPPRKGPTDGRNHDTQSYIPTVGMYTDDISKGGTMARNPHPEVTERRILAAAKKLFAEKGYDKTLSLIHI